MHEFTNEKSGQYRPANGMAFWSFSADVLRNLESDPDSRKVHWDGREWICKQDDRTLNEVVGYQIASAIGLPVQPWLAFESPAPRSIGAGMFIEWWKPKRLKSSLIGLDASHAAFSARGLAFDVFRRPEGDCPDWLLSGDQREVRFIDLDGTGPKMHVPPDETSLCGYIDDTETVFSKARSDAGQLGITKAFCAEIHRLLAVDFSTVVDFSGYPSASALTKVMLSALKERQQVLAQLLRTD